MTTDTDIFDDIYGSKYFSVTDLHSEMPRYKIGKVELRELKEKDGTAKRKFIVYFDGVEKPLVLNKTNATKLAASFGKDRADWIGVIVELYAEMTSLGKEGVRLRPLKPARGQFDLPAGDVTTKLDRLARADDPISTGRPRKANDMDDEVPFAPEVR